MNRKTLSLLLLVILVSGCGGGRSPIKPQCPDNLVLGQESPACKESF